MNSEFLIALPKRVNFSSQKGDFLFELFKLHRYYELMINFTQKFMNTKTFISIIFICITMLATGCNMSAMYENFQENGEMQQSDFNLAFSNAIEQESPELSISALREIQSFPNNDSHIKVQAAIAYYSLSDPETLFLPEANRLAVVSDGKSLHQLDTAIQVLLYLRHRANNSATNNVRAGQQVRAAVDALCNIHADFGLNQYIEDINELNARSFRRNMAHACTSLLINDKSDQLHAHLMSGTMMQSIDSVCTLEQDDDSTSPIIATAVVATWFECELKQATGIDMQTTLEL